MPSRLAPLVLTALVVGAGCAGERGPAADSLAATAGASAAVSAGDASAGRGGSVGAPAPRDPVPLTATADVGGRSYRFEGQGDCQHAGDASIYEKPAAMWTARFGAADGDVRHANLTLWRLAGASDVQVSLHLMAGNEMRDVSTVQGAPTKGSATARVEPRGQGGTLTVDGRDDAGRSVRLVVDCPRFTYPVAEGG